MGQIHTMHRLSAVLCFVLLVAMSVSHSSDKLTSEYLVPKINEQILPSYCSHVAQRLKIPFELKLERVLFDAAKDGGCRMDHEQHSPTLEFRIDELVKLFDCSESQKKGFHGCGFVASFYCKEISDNEKAVGTDLKRGDPCRFAKRKTSRGYLNVDLNTGLIDSVKLFPESVYKRHLGDSAEGKKLYEQERERNPAFKALYGGWPSVEQRRTYYIPACEKLTKKTWRYEPDACWRAGRSLIDSTKKEKASANEYRRYFQMGDAISYLNKGCELGHDDSCRLQDDFAPSRKTLRNGLVAKLQIVVESLGIEGVVIAAEQKNPYMVEFVKELYEIK